MALDCSIEGCVRAARKRGWCDTHYTGMRRRGEIELLPLLSAGDRLTAGLTRTPSGCLEWSGSTDDRGYGRIGIGRKTFLTHRVAWELANGPIPEGVCVLHHCDNPPCGETEPSEAYPEGHLFLGTRADNNADMSTKGRRRNGRETKTHCPQRHEYAGANLYIDPRGQRACKECNRAAGIRLYIRKKALQAGDSTLTELAGS
jgi:hypothetical protein